MEISGNYKRIGGEKSIICQGLDVTCGTCGECGCDVMLLTTIRL